MAVCRVKTHSAAIAAAHEAARASILLNVLCLDPDGGHGGSSKSLFYTLAAIRPESFKPVVWCRRDYGMPALYRSTEIECRVMSGMTKISPLPKLSRDIVDHANFTRAWIANRAFRRELLATAKRHDIVHFNHESLVFLAAWLSRRTSTPISGHIRTMASAYPGFSPGLHARTLAKAASGLIYISENEQTAFHRHARASRETVIFNPVPQKLFPRQAVTVCNDASPLIVLCVSNSAWVRGTDRVIDIASELRRLAPTAPVRFRIAGDMKVDDGGQNEILAGIADKGGTLADYAAVKGVGDLVECLGYVERVDDEIRKAHIALKPTREDNPWGRDIIEAMAGGIPVISVGQETCFVETNVTGLLQDRFDAKAVAETLLEFVASPSTMVKLGHNAAERIAQLCNPMARAADVLSFWQSLLKERA